ncbi:hypothetical protein [Rhodoferax sp.]|uniref:hypothetical protein n=1 Tax=Rhodoferax sp. TaxID=50421 RepID=UPI002ACE4C43|nr:hypothetical protein [Rhodoferax sp.]MDZ7919569.1 hypothetical protein [Rhodoferax sp.]
MPDITQFISEPHLLAYQRALPRIQQDQVAHLAWDSHDESYGVGGNTFRAYTGWQSSPSRLFRNWACHTSQTILQTDPSSLDSMEAFEGWHQGLSCSLQQKWMETQGRGLSVAHKYKLIDLYIKWLTQHSLPDPALGIQFVRFGHCALDRQTLAKINAHLSGALPLAKPTMGLIATEETYSLCQAVVREYCVVAGGAPVLFDYFAWQPGA